MLCVFCIISTTVGSLSATRWGVSCGRPSPVPVRRGVMYACNGRAGVAVGVENAPPVAPPVDEDDVLVVVVLVVTVLVAAW